MQVYCDFLAPFSQAWTRSSSLWAWRHIPLCPFPFPGGELMMWGPRVAGLAGLEEQVCAAGARMSCWCSFLAPAPITLLPWARKEPGGNWWMPQVLLGLSRGSRREL